jgi:deoxyribodipyrimidine photo-lyase
MAKHVPNFPTDYDAILRRIANLKPKEYAKSRNYIDGAVSYLSPYISRGVISTKQVFQLVLAQGYAPNAIEKFIQELAWRDYWQQVWRVKIDEINSDLKHEQQSVTNHEMPLAVLEATTEIEDIDHAITAFYETGYLHNHVRMYLASISCNVANSHWKHPAQWMYYHLLDGDWASNALSWQWVAGANSNKKYYANQENINRYCHTHQKNTFLDVDYEALPEMAIPTVLKATVHAKLVTPLPIKTPIHVDQSKPSCIYNYYNLDPNWRKEEAVNRILLLEPSVFEQYPIGQKAVNFMLALAKNIPNIQVYVGEFSELLKEYQLSELYYKEHPLNTTYSGTEDPRDWMFNVKGYYPSFFAFWKKCKKELRF